MLSLSEFKSLLQISGDTYDDLFAIYEPIVADVVKQITRVSYGLTFDVTSTTGSYILESTESFYDVYEGADVQGDNIPDASIYSFCEHSITIDKRATDSGSFTLTVSPVPSALKLAVAKMVLYDIQSSTVDSANQSGVTSKSMGVLSVSYDDSNKIDQNWGYPKALIALIKRFKRTQIDVGSMRNPYTNTTNRYMI